MEERFSRWKTWIASHYKHPSMDSHSSSGLTLQPSTDPDKPSTMTLMTPQEQEDAVSLHGIVHGEFPVRKVPTEVLARNRERALSWGEDEEAIWEDISVEVLQCENSLKMCVQTLWLLEDEYKERNRAGKSGRSMGFHWMTGANHFVCALFSV